MNFFYEIISCNLLNAVGHASILDRLNALYTNAMNHSFSKIEYLIVVHEEGRIFSKLLIR